MTAREVPMNEIVRPQRPSPLVGMGARLAMLRHDLDELDNCWREFWASPFPDTQTAEDSKQYAADEDDHA